MNAWIEKDNSLQKTYIFDSFLQAIAWMNQAAIEIEKIDHHPEWTNIYNKVFVKLCSHDAGNLVTERDHQLASILDAVSV